MLDFQHILLLYLKNYYNISFYLIILFLTVEEWMNARIPCKIKGSGIFCHAVFCVLFSISLYREKFFSFVFD